MNALRWRLAAGALLMAALFAFGAGVAGAQTGAAPGGGAPASSGAAPSEATAPPSSGEAPDDMSAPDAEEGADADALPSPPAPEEPGLSARGRYNLGLERLADGEAAPAAVAFLTARDNAGPDPQLRYRAAFNLGVALAARANPAMEPEEEIETLRESAAWFTDAVRLAPPDDDDARINLEIISRRILELADLLNQGNRLETRLDRLIDDQRVNRDRVRQLLAEIEARGAGAEPVGFKTAFDALATRERVLVAEVGDVIDLAAEERLYLEQTPEEELPPEQRVRLHQLSALVSYLERSRQSLSDARRRLRRLAGEPAHRRADAALAEMKRAREQLLDPLVVLRAVASDEQELARHTKHLAEFAQGAVQVDAPPPPWITHEHLGERQADIAGRSGQVLARFEAVLEAGREEAAAAAAAKAAKEEEEARKAAAENARKEDVNTADDTATPDGEGDAVADGETDAEEEDKVLRAVREATPFLTSAVEAMQAAGTAFGEEDAPGALERQEAAIVDLRQAIERFADHRGLIELAYADQQTMVELLAPEKDGEEKGAHAGLTVLERAEVLAGLTADNQRRLERLEEMFREESERIASELESGLEAEAGEAEEDDGGSSAGAPAAQQQQGQQAAPPGALPTDALPPEEKEALEAEKQRFELAETFRAEAAVGIETLVDEARRFAVCSPEALSDSLSLPEDAAEGVDCEEGGAKDPAPRMRAAAQESLTALEELRRLFFSIVEHLMELHTEQTDTHDRSATLEFEAASDESAAAAAAPELGLLSERQTRHGQVGDALTTALEKHADAALAPNAPPAAAGGPGGPTGEQLAEAATEVRNASGRMHAAATLFGDAVERASGTPLVLEPALEDQLAAIEHIENALALLLPPPPEGEGGGGGDQDLQQQQQMSAEDERMSQRQAERRLQSIRDREAERNRRRREQPAAREPVEKDW